MEALTDSDTLRPEMPLEVGFAELVFDGPPRRVVVRHPDERFGDAQPEHAFFTPERVFVEEGID